MMEPNTYIETRNGGWYVAGTRISLDSIVYSFREGLSPESIVHDCFPSLTLEQVYGTIAFYLANRSDVDRYLEEEILREEELVASLPPIPTALSEKLAAARRQMLMSKRS